MSSSSILIPSSLFIVLFSLISSASHVLSRCSRIFRPGKQCRSCRGKGLNQAISTCHRLLLASITKPYGLAKVDRATRRRRSYFFFFLAAFLAGLAAAFFFLATLTSSGKNSVRSLYRPPRYLSLPKHVASTSISQETESSDSHP